LGKYHSIYIYQNNMMPSEPMKKILSAALAFSMMIANVAVHAQAPAANPAPEAGAAAGQPTAGVGAGAGAGAGAAAPAVGGSLAGMTGVAGLSLGATVAVGLGAVAVAAAAGGGGGGGGGTTGSVGTRYFAQFRLSVTRRTSRRGTFLFCRLR